MQKSCIAYDGWDYTTVAPKCEGSMSLEENRAE